MSELRVAIIGHTGRGDYGHGLDVVWTQIPGCRVTAVADPDPQGREAARRRLGAEADYADYRQMLARERPQIVSICPRWLDQHRDMVVAAAEHQAHIYLEKPFCRSLAEADEMIEACRRNNVKLAIAFQTRYSPKLPVVRELIEEGAIGRVLEVRGRGKEDRRGGGEDLWVLGSHIMNLMHHLVGEPRWCFGRVLHEGQPVRAEHVRAGNEGIGPLAGDQVTAVYGFDDGVTGYFNSQQNAGPGGTGRFGVTILGEQGQIEIQTGYLPPVHLLQDPLWSPGRSGRSWQPVSSQGVAQAEPLDDLGLAGGNVLACRDLLEAIQQDRQPEANMFEARTTVEMIAGVFESHRRAQPVAMPLQNRANPLELL